MHGCDSWTIKKAEHWRIDAFELWCWRRLLRVPWTARRSNQSILKEISPNCSLEGLTLKLKLQYIGHVMGRTDSLEKTLMLGKIEGREEEGNRGWDGSMASPTQWTWVWANFRRWWWTGRPGVLQSMGLQRVGLSDWTDLSNIYFLSPCKLKYEFCKKKKKKTSFTVLQYTWCCRKGSEYPPQNMPLWHEDYFELKATLKQHTQLDVLPLSFPL